MHDNDQPFKDDQPVIVISSGVLLTSMPDIFFLVEERSDGASEAWAGVPASASLRAGAGALSKADRTNIFIDTDKHIDTHEKKEKNWSYSIW